MPNSSFKENIISLLSATEYSFDFKADHLKSLENYENLKPFFEWFNLHVSRENCITVKELEEYKKLENDGELLFGEELSDALKDNGLDNHMYYSESYDEISCEINSCINEQKQFLEKLEENIKSSTSKIMRELSALGQETNENESKQAVVLEEICAVNKTYKKKLSEIKHTLLELRKNISELDQGLDVSADEGIHTLTSNNLNNSTWSLSSMVSWQSESEKGSSSRYICQLPLDRYEKEHKRFLKDLERVQTAFSKIRNSEESEIEPELELLNIMERLCKQKYCLTLKTLELECIKAEQEKIKEIYNAVQDNQCLPDQLITREDLNDCSESDVSFNIQEEDLKDLCQKWAECLTLQPTCERLQYRCDSLSFFIEKMSELLSILKKKLGIDEVLSELLEINFELVKKSIEYYSSVQEIIKQKVEAVKRRGEVMDANLKDYNIYYNQDFTLRCGLLNILATMLEVSAGGVEEKISSKTEASQKNFESFYNETIKHHKSGVIKKQCIQNILNEEMWNVTNIKSNAKPELCESIQRQIDTLNHEVQDIIHCQSLQVNGEVQGRRK